MNIFTSFPARKELLEWYLNLPEHPLREVNGHLHTPFSFSAFNDIEELFRMANKERVDVLGINDFYVTDGYYDFYNRCMKHTKFPLFNIEFIGLLKEAQEQGIRINDPNNPGRIYLSGKGLDYPFHLNWINRRKLKRVIKETQHQVRQMIKKSNDLLQKIDPAMKLDFNQIKKQYAKELVRERHIAKAIGMLANEKYPDPLKREQILKALYGKEPVADLKQPAAVENEIRTNLLKAGGRAFVQEDPSSFMPLEQVIKIIIAAGGIPCYPVLLDNAKGNFTEFELTPEQLSNTLTKHGIGFIELIPGRNDSAILKAFVTYFHQKEFGIIFGTEHNSPGMIPITVSARNQVPLDRELKTISFEGAALIAAHQYLRAKKQPGLSFIAGKPGIQQKGEHVTLGKAVIEYYITHLNNEG